MAILTEIIYFSISLTKDFKNSLFLKEAEILHMYFFPLESNGDAVDVHCNSQFEQEFCFLK